MTEESTWEEVHPYITVHDEEPLLYSSDVVDTADDPGIITLPTTYAQGPDLVAQYLGRTLDDDERKAAELHLRNSTTLIRAATKGGGFENGRIAEPLQAVITSHAVRTMANPTDMSSFGSAGLDVRPGRVSLTLFERTIIEQYRKKSGSIPTT